MDEFLERFPEFESTSPRLIELAIDEAKSSLNPDRWGRLYAQAWKYLAAHKLAVSPMGEPVRLEGSNTTTYWAEYERLCRSMHLGALVI